MGFDDSGDFEDFFSCFAGWSVGFDDCEDLEHSASCSLMLFWRFFRFVPVIGLSQFPQLPLGIALFSNFWNSPWSCVIILITRILPIPLSNDSAPALRRGVDLTLLSKAAELGVAVDLIGAPRIGAATRRAATSRIEEKLTMIVCREKVKGFLNEVTLKVYCVVARGGCLIGCSCRTRTISGAA